MFDKTPFLLHQKLAGALGFEPRLADPESAVLPLYDAPKKPKKNYLCKKSACQTK